MRTVGSRKIAYPIGLLSFFFLIILPDFSFGAKFPLGPISSGLFYLVLSIGRFGDDCFLSIVYITVSGCSDI